MKQLSYLATILALVAGMAPSFLPRPKAKYRGATQMKRRSLRFHYESDHTPGSKIRKKMAKGTLTKNGIR